MLRTPLIILLLSLLWVAPVTAAPLADEHTILYYLIEMHRRHGKGCGAGVPATPPPSLIPSVQLGQAAAELARSSGGGKLVSTQAQAGTKTFIVQGATAQQAFAQLKEQYCSALVDPAYASIGAAHDASGWVVLLAVAAPGGVPPQEPATASALPFAQEDKASETPLLDAQDPIFTASALPEPAPAPRPGITPLHDTDPPRPVPIETMNPTPQPAQDPLPRNQSGQMDSKQAEPFMPVQSRVGGQETKTEQELLGLINQVRATGGYCGNTQMLPAPPLQKKVSLASLAATHLRQMLALNFFASTHPDGTRMGERLTKAGYPWFLVAENLIKGSHSARGTLDAWLGNASQCKNMLNSQYLDAGISYDPGTGTWVLTLVAPVPASGEGVLQVTP